MFYSTTKSLAKSDRLISVLSRYDGCFIVMHDNPDPDAIAAGWGLQCLISEKLEMPVRLVGGGAIVRAENRHMVEVLQPPIELLDEIELPPDTATVLVDCSPTTENHLLKRQGIRPVGVIDHHMNGSSRMRLSFRDIRDRVAASATIVASYLREQDVEPGAKLATAMQYAIRTETMGSETRHTRLDRSIIVWLTARSEPELIAEIENAPLERDYFGDLVLAMQSTFLYGDAAFCLLPRAHCSEIVGEVADLLIRCRGASRILCGALVGRDVVISARTADGAGHAAKLLQRALEGIGFGGGHAHRAGGKIAGIQKMTEEIENELRMRWLAACQVDRRRGTRLVPKRDIVENL